MKIILLWSHLKHKQRFFVFWCSTACSLIILCYKYDRTLSKIPCHSYIQNYWRDQNSYLHVFSVVRLNIGNICTKEQNVAIFLFLQILPLSINSLCYRIVNNPAKFKVVAAWFDSFKNYWYSFVITYSPIPSVKLVKFT